MDVLKLLNSKNRCLRGFLTLSEDFLARLDAQGAHGLQDSLPEFQERRETVLKALDLYDRKISETLEAMPRVEKTPELVDAVRSALEQKESLVKRILELDLRIISHIEEAKSALLRELSGARKSKEILGKFKSGWMPESGEGIDEKL